MFEPLSLQKNSQNHLQISNNFQKLPNSRPQARCRSSPIFSSIEHQKLKKRKKKRKKKPMSKSFNLFLEIQLIKSLELFRRSPPNWLKKKKSLKSSNTLQCNEERKEEKNKRTLYFLIPTNLSAYSLSHGKESFSYSSKIHSKEKKEKLCTRLCHHYDHVKIKPLIRIRSI